MNRRAVVTLAASLGAGGVVACLLLSLTPVQTRLARVVVGARLAEPVTFDRVAISWNRIEIEGMRFGRGPVTVLAPNVVAEVSVWRLFTGTARIRSLVAHGWSARWAPSAPSQVTGPTAGADPVGPPRQGLAGWGGWLAQLANGAGDGASSAAAPDLESWLQLPMEVEIEKLDLVGYAEWRDAGPGEDGHARVSFSGGDLMVGKKSRLVVTIAAESEAVVGTSIQTLNIEAALGVQLAAPDRIGGIWIASTLRGKRASHSRWDVYKFDFGFDGSGPTPRLQFTLADEVRTLFRGDILAGSSDTGLSGDWAVSLTDDNVTSLMLGTVMPEFSINGTGKIRSNYELTELDLAGRVEFQADRLEVFEPRVGAIGELTGTLDFAGKRRADDVRITRWDLTLQGAQPVMRAHLLQGVEYSVAGLEVRVERPSDPVLVVDVMGFPLNWLQPWMSPWVIDGRPISGQLVALATDRGVRFVTSDTLTGSGLVVAHEGQSLVEGLDLSLTFGSEITTEGWQVEIDRMEVGDASGLWVELSARGGQLIAENDVFKLAGRVQANLAAPNRLPLLQGRWGLAGGRMDGEFGVGVSDRISLAVAMDLKNLVTSDDRDLPNLQLDGRVDRLPDGAIEVHLPMQFTRGERISDITLNSRLDPQEGGWNLEGSLSGPRAYLGDIQLLATGLAVKSDSAAAASVLGNEAGGGLVPIWRGWTGRFETAIGLLEMPHGLSLANLRGELQLTADGISLNALRASVGPDGVIAGTGRLGFDASRPDAYTLEGKLDATAVEAGPWLKRLEVASPLPFEGKVNVAAKWSSAAESWDSLAAQSQVEATLTSSGGVLRVLGVDVTSYVNAGKTVSALGGLLALASGDTRTQTYAVRLQSLSSVAEQLAALTFDQLNVVVKRAPGGDLDVSEISLISPHVRLLGSGRIHYEAEVPLWHQPLSMNLRLSARDQLAANLKTLNLLDAQADALGYIPVAGNVVLDGSLAKVGTTQLQQLLSRALTAP